MRKTVRFFLLSIFISAQILFAQWIQTSGLSSGHIHSLAVNETNLFAGTSSGVFLSTNNGSNWTQVNSGLTNTIISSFAVSGTNLFAGTGGGVFLSTNNGSSWTSVNSGLTTLEVMALSGIGTNLFAGTYGGGVFLSANNGSSWTAVNSGLPSSTDVYSLGVSGTNLYAGTYSSSFGDLVFLSTNNGSSWIQANSGLPPAKFVYCLAVIETNLFAGTSGGGVFLSTNNGSSWTAVNTGLTYGNVRSFAVSGAYLFAGTYYGGVFLSTNNGSSWTAVNSGLPLGTDVNCLVVSGTNLLAGTSGSGVWRRSLSEMITSVERVLGDLPTHFTLEQNYPNPFNPTTTIEYQIPKSAFVTLKIFDMLGREVATLVNEKKDAGRYTVQWNAGLSANGISAKGGYAAGVYFYQLMAEDKTTVKKMVLMK